MFNYNSWSMYEPNILFDEFSSVLALMSSIDLFIFLQLLSALVDAYVNFNNYQTVEPANQDFIDTSYAFLNVIDQFGSTIRPHISRPSKSPIELQ